MSKFTDAINAEFTGKVKPSLVNNLSASIEIKPNPEPYGYVALKEYKIGATYGLTGYCQQEELPHVLENFIKGLKRDVYSTLMNDLIRLERAIYEQDLYEAKSVMRDIWVEVK